MTEIQGKSILVRVSARFELARVRVIGSRLYVPRNNSPNLPVARNILSQILIVQQYEQEEITRMTVIQKSEKHIFN